jgi:hypothetical protein
MIRGIGEAPMGRIKGPELRALLVRIVLFIYFKGNFSFTVNLHNTRW